MIPAPLRAAGPIAGLLLVGWALGCQRAAPPARSSDQAVEVHAGLSYRPSSDHPKHRLDLYRLAGISRAPVIVFVHGGYWVSGDRHAPEHGPGLYGRLGRALARRGIVAAVVSYRLAPEVDIEAMLDDVACAVGWVWKHAPRYGGNPARLYLVGHSAGGHLVALLAAEDGALARYGLERSDVSGTIALAAIWDVPAMAASQPERFNRAVTRPVFGTDPERQRRFSPLWALKSRRRDFLLMVGERDFAYLIEQAPRALEQLHATGTEATLRIVPGYDHLDLVRRFGEPGDPVIDHVAELVSAGR